MCTHVLCGCAHVHVCFVYYDCTAQTVLCLVYVCVRARVACRYDSMCAVCMFCVCERVSFGYVHVWPVLSSCIAKECHWAQATGLALRGGLFQAVQPVGLRHLQLALDVPLLAGERHTVEPPALWAGLGHGAGHWGGGEVVMSTMTSIEQTTAVYKLQNCNSPNLQALYVPFVTINKQKCVRWCARVHVCVSAFTGARECVLRA